MSNQLKIFNIVKNKFLKLDDTATTWKFGHYNPNNCSIVLYDVLNNSDNHNQIKRHLDKITTSYHYVVEHNTWEYTNVSILDIGL